MATLTSHIPCPAWLGFEITVQTEIPDGCDYLTRENLSKHHINVAFNASMAVSAEIREHERMFETYRGPVKAEAQAQEEVSA